MNKFLKGRSIYISSAMEHGTENKWRAGLHEELQRRFGLNVFDPIHDSKQQWSSDLMEARNKRDFEEMSRIAHLFVRKDLAKIDRADILFAVLEFRGISSGLWHEVVVATQAKKPIIYCTLSAKELAPAWLFGIIPHEFIFGPIEDALKYLERVDRGEEVHRRWDFVQEKL